MHSWLNQAEDQLRLLNYSTATRKTYLHCLKEYFAHSEHPEEMRKDEIRSFLLKKHHAGCGPQTINLYLNAISFFYRRVLQKTDGINIKFAKRGRKLPIVLNKSEILKVIESTANAKHRLMIALAYSSGMRVSEVVNLKVQDVDTEQLILHIKQAKGNKDRLTVFSETLKADMLQAMNGKEPCGYIFESERGGKLTRRTAQNVFHRSLRKAGVVKPATFHSLRHSFATHLIEDGVNLRYVQELLGHHNIKTTELYTRVSTQSLLKIRSPL